MSTMQGAKGCQNGGYDGYHFETRMTATSSADVVYSVSLQCAAAAGTVFDELMLTLSHEASEAATDPHPATSPAFRNQTSVLGGEIGDLCVGLNAKVDLRDDGGAPLTYFVQREYSQKVAMAGNADPCTPAPDRPYFNVGVLPRDITVTGDPRRTVMTSATIEPYAFGEVGLIKWTLATEIGPGVSVTPSNGSVHAGDTIPFAITIAPAAKPGDYPILLVAQSQLGGTNYWYSSLTVQ
jgi:hypothetical protein